MRIAALQLTGTPSPQTNRDTVGRLLRQAAAARPDVVVLPEIWNVTGPHAAMRAGAEPLDGPGLSWLGGEVDRVFDRRPWVVAGSIVEAPASGQEQCANTLAVFDDDGRRRAVYRKTHLFDCDVPGAILRESDTFRAGDELVVADVAGVRSGLAICYDLRFGEVFTALAAAGARVVYVPAAFTARTGEAHWELLVRCRAVENQVFVVAVDQCGSSTDRLSWFGHSMVVDPWGRIIATAGDDEEVLVADLDLDEVDRVRAQMPVAAHRREGLRVVSTDQSIESGASAP